MASCTMIETRHCNHSQGRVKSRVACTSPGNTGALEHVHKHDDDGSRKQGTKIRRNAGRLDSPLIGSPGRKPGGNSADDGQGTAVQGVELADVDGGDADDTDEQGTKGANEPEWLPQAVSVLQKIEAWCRVRSSVGHYHSHHRFIHCVSIMPCIASTHPESDEDEDASNSHDVLLPAQLVHVLPVLRKVRLQLRAGAHRDFEPEDVLCLAQTDGDGGARHEAADDGVGEELHEPAHAKGADAGVHAGDDEGDLDGLRGWQQWENV